MFGPLTSLRLRGAICPCLLSTDESIAKQSDSNLQTFLNDGSCTVKWHSFDSSSNNKSNRSKSIGGFLSKMITSNNDGSSSSSSCVIIESKIELIDTKEGTVCLDISAISTTEHQQIPFKSIGSFKPFTSKPSWTSNLTNNINTSSENSNIVSIYSKLNNNDVEDNGGGGGKERELARLEFTHHQDNSSEVKINAHDICEYLTNIWNWDEARRLAIGEEENNGNDDEQTTSTTDSSSKSSTLGQPGTMKGRAQKAAHFAKREIELQQKKREREQRKAKYLKEAGGLKYTAIAMANRS